MRALPLLAVALLVVAACSKNDTNSAGQASQDFTNTGKDLAGVAHQAATSPDWKKARADLRRLGHDLGVEARKAGAEANNDAKQASDDTKRESHKLAADTHRSAAHRRAHEAHRRSEDSG